MSVLKAAMAKKGYRQSDVAKAAAVSRQAVSLWFAGEGDFRNVHVANLLSLSAGLGISPAELLQPLPGLGGARRGAAVVRGVLLGPVVSGYSMGSWSRWPLRQPRAVARIDRVPRNIRGRQQC